MGMFAHRGNSRLRPNMGGLIHMCVTRGHGVRRNSGVTNHRNGGNIISHIVEGRSVPFLPSNAPMRVMLGPLNMPSHVGVNRILRARLK